MGASQAKQIKRAAPVWMWDGYWWPAIVANALSRLAFVTPAIVEAICQGQQPAELNAETLLNRTDLPLEWPAQRNALGMK